MSEKMNLEINDKSVSEIYDYYMERRWKENDKNQNETIQHHISLIINELRWILSKDKNYIPTFFQLVLFKWITLEIEDKIHFLFIASHKTKKFDINDFLKKWNEIIPNSLELLNNESDNKKDLTYWIDLLSDVAKWFKVLDMYVNICDEICYYIEKNYDFK